MLGHKLVQRLQTDFDVWTTVRTESAEFGKYEILPDKKVIGRVDADDFDSVLGALDSARPDVVINSIGIVKQLPTSRDFVKTLTVNSIFPHRLAEAVSERGSRLVTISTDCVFKGDKGNYSESDEPDALDLYGTSKRLGEVIAPNVLTLRTSIIGRELCTSHSLIEWFLSNRGRAVKGFSQAIYSGFPTIVFADIISSLLRERPDLAGLYHVSSEPISKFELLCMVNRKFGLDIRIEQSDDIRIDRSLNSGRFREETGFVPPSWEVMVERMAIDPTPYIEWRTQGRQTL